VSTEPSWGDIFNGQPQPAAQRPPITRRELREAESAASKGGRSSGGGSTGSGYGAPPKKRKRRLGWLWALLVVLALGAGAAGGVWVLFEDKVRAVMGWELPIDYTTTGNGEEALVVIKSGDIGSDIASTLHEAGVTMTSKAFYQLLLSLDPAPTFIPGTYSLQKEMSAESALAALQDPANVVVSKVTIPEGTTIKGTLQKLSDGTGIPLEEFQAAAEDPTQYGVPSKAPSLEGFLFPATYNFDPGQSATDILQTMVDRTYQSLDAAGVAPKDRLRVLSFAALIQKEGGSTKDFYKVARVFQNRLDKSMLMQSDATVSYGSGSKSIFTTGAERADASNKYNTYVHPGLPFAPICAPGDAAIDAALHPAKGSWIYFVLVNGETGETKFSNTLAEHNAAVQQWQAWFAAHPDFSN
jgi:UPF0755 protein